MQIKIAVDCSHDRTSLRTGLGFLQVEVRRSVVTEQERVLLRDEALELLQQGQLIPNGPGDQLVVSLSCPSSCCYIGAFSSRFALSLLLLR